ncbi:uncharacterized protein Z518_03705 [Rhinocladiella mackenziei CBS 650.93]|uniref:Uncharacterized protein n=1 Tax=Rhinocladiella mackenziei CBS 650.93 TaxID=1442369 RepID=A0A0D2H5P8_9EURO|nr:uncharacterized protein Z518_03705 [Rhinocladiella mackenziei CBS 650.93]KIX05733.1 hypothetical protein Z518_03705 [Rhinocladiella mackenziei CBS 650.93]
MQLRSNISAPVRLEEEDFSSRRKGKGPARTRPAYPDLLRKQVISFDPNNPPAAFPSLPLTARKSLDASQLTESLSEEELSFSIANLRINQNEAPGGRARTQQCHEHFDVQDTATNDNNNGMDLDDLSMVGVRTIERMVDEQVVGPDIAREQDQGRVTRTGHSNAWDSLPLSLQYHIYTRLSEDRSSEALAELLGLTEYESSQIQRAVGLRSLHPTSVAEIWDYCRHIGPEIPGLEHPPSFIDLNVFKDYVDYMVFASNYEFAYPSELERAWEFLQQHQIPTSVLGVWQQDPSDIRDSAFFTYVAENENKSEYVSSCAREDYMGDQGDSFEDIRSGTLNREVKKQITAASGTVHNSKKTWLHSHFLNGAGRNKLKARIFKQRSQNTHRPLSVVTFPSEPPSPPCSPPRSIQNAPDGVDQPGQTIATRLSKEPESSRDFEWDHILNTPVSAKVFGNMSRSMDAIDGLSSWELETDPRVSLRQNQRQIPPTNSPARQKPTLSGNLIKTIDNRDCYHSEAKDSCDPGTRRKRNSNRTIRPVESRLIRSIESSSESQEAIFKNWKGAKRSRLLVRTPSYSPISENEDFDWGKSDPSTSLRALSCSPIPENEDLEELPGLIRGDHSRARINYAYRLGKVNEPTPGTGCRGSVVEPNPKIKLVMKNLKRKRDADPVSHEESLSNSFNSPQVTERRRSKTTWEGEDYDESPKKLKIKAAAKSKPKAKLEAEPKMVTRAARRSIEIGLSNQSMSVRKRGPRGPYRKTRERLAKRQDCIMADIDVRTGNAI